jgi:hypothetical protein
LRTNPDEEDKENRASKMKKGGFLVIPPSLNLEFDVWKRNLMRETPLDNIAFFGRITTIITSCRMRSLSSEELSYCSKHVHHIDLFPPFLRSKPITNIAKIESLSSSSDSGLSSEEKE